MSSRSKKIFLLLSILYVAGKAKSEKSRVSAEDELLKRAYRYSPQSGRFVYIDYDHDSIQEQIAIDGDEKVLKQYLGENWRQLEEEAERDPNKFCYESKEHREKAYGCYKWFAELEADAENASDRYCMKEPHKSYAETCQNRDTEHLCKVNPSHLTCRRLALEKDAIRDPFQCGKYVFKTGSMVCVRLQRQALLEPIKYCVLDPWESAVDRCVSFWENEFEALALKNEDFCSVEPWKSESQTCQETPYISEEC